MQKTYFYRGLFYLMGLLILALGITLNTKTGLGVSPIISVSFSISTIWHFNFGNTTLVLFVVVEMILHTIRSLHARQSEGLPLEHANQMNLKLVLFMDILQFPLSLIFTRFLNIFSGMIPDLWTTYPDSFAGSFPGRILFLIIAIILTGVGAAMSLNMRIIPNPGDGIVQAISDFILTISVGLIFAHHLVGIGIGTVLAVIGVGRAIAAFNHFFKQPMAVLSGMNES